MNKEGTALLELNKEILASPGSSGDHALIKLLELEKPDLNFLCPLAKAIYLVETNRAKHVDPLIALANCMAVDYTFSGYPGSDDHAEVSEEVTHFIETKFGGKKITLGFESSGNMTHCTSFWREYLRVEWGTEWPLDLLEQPAEFIEELFNKFKRGIENATPEAYPTDNGEFLGSLSYTLRTINGINIDGPEYAYSNGDDTWEGLSDEFSQRLSGRRSDCDGQMCWLHYIDAETALQLGISAEGDNAIGNNPDYPAWVGKTASKKELDATWISPDDLQVSYSKGKLSIQESTEVCLLIGFGADWDPSLLGKEDEEEEFDEDEDDEDEDEGEASDQSTLNPLTEPLIEIAIERGSKELSNQFSILKPYLIKFNKMILG